MITTVTNDGCYEFRGLSADPKPTETSDKYKVMTNGSIFLEIDTCKVFCWDAQNKTWVELK